MNKTLRELRIEKGETLKQVGKALGVGAGNVSTWELGRSSPWPRYIPKIAKHFGISNEDARQAVENSKPAAPLAEAASAEK